MDSHTGQVAEVEAKSSSSRGMERKTFSDENIAGGGFLSLMGKPTNNLKATIVGTNEQIMQVSVPTEGFLAVGDVVSYVIAEDDIIAHYYNHTRELGWSFAHPRKGIADKVKLHSRLLNWSAFIGTLAWLLSLGFPSLFAITLISGSVFFYAIFWTVFIFRGSLNKNYEAGEALIKEEKARYPEYLSRKASERTARLRQAVSA